MNGFYFRQTMVKDLTVKLQQGGASLGGKFSKLSNFTITVKYKNIGRVGFRVYESRYSAQSLVYRVVIQLHSYKIYALSSKSFQIASDVALSLDE